MKNAIIEQTNFLISKGLIDIDKIPNIDLYVDQLTSFIEANSFSNQEGNLTKSMVNNYCKNKIIPPSEKKKYNKNHILLLTIIYNSKSIISISDIKKIFDSFEEEKVPVYYETLATLLVKSQESFSEEINTYLDNINFENNKITNKESLAILATKLAIEANYKKMLSELIIEKFL